MVGCTTRYQLATVDITRARAQGGVERLFVYPSSRTVSVYERRPDARTRIGPEIEERSAEDQLRKVLTRHTAGTILDHDRVNGAHRLYVSFDPTCSNAECAYEFVQTENGRYRLAGVPQREGFAPPRVYRDLVLPRRKMSPGHMRSMGEANSVYRILRKRRVLTVLLEVEIRKRERTRRTTVRERGRPDR